MVSSLKDERWLQWVERLVESSSPMAQGGELSPSRFHCLLDGQPDHLTPAHSLRNWDSKVPDQRLVVNPCAFFAPDGVPSHAWLADSSLLQNFALPSSVMWVRDPESEVLYPFWLGPKFRPFVTALEPGQPAPGGLPSEIRSPLRTAGILVPEDWTTLCSHRWLAVTSRGAETFARKGYVPVPNLLHPFHIASLRRYYRHMVRTGGMTYGDSQAPRRFFIHNESVAGFFHRQWTRIVSAIVGEPVKPSYVYVACYQDGATLVKHTDREQCEFSITLSLDYTPEPRTCTPWPLKLQTGSATTTVYQALGDGLLYRGREFPHWREPLCQGNTSSSIFFHYVRRNFSGSLV